MILKTWTVSCIEKEWSSSAVYAILMRKESYQIQSALFAIEEDWQLACAGSVVYEVLGTEKLYPSDGVSYTPDSIFHFDYEVVILKLGWQGKKI